MPYVDVAGRRIFYAYRRSRLEAVATTVLIHGAAGSHLDWPAQLRHMAHADVFALDLPGHGRSPTPGLTTVAAYADLVVAFIRKLQLERTVIIGHSMGGAIAQSIGLRNMPVVNGLVLIGSGARLRVHKELLLRLRQDFDQAVATLAGAYWGSTPPDELAQRTEERIRQSDRRVAYGDFIACHNFDVIDQLTAIDVPTLIIAGSADRMTPEKYGRFLAAHLPHSQLLVVPGAGHLMALEYPEEVSAAVAAFFSRLDDEDR